MFLWTALSISHPSPPPPPPPPLPMKISSVVAFSQTLRRYTSLNHLAQAARAVLLNSSQINQMLADLNRVDFANVQVRSCVCVCTSIGFCFRHNFFSHYFMLCLLVCLFVCCGVTITTPRECGVCVVIIR